MPQKSTSKHKFNKTICNLNPIFCCVILVGLILGISALLDLDTVYRMTDDGKQSQALGYWIISGNGDPNNPGIVVSLSKLGIFAFIFLGLGLISTTIILITNRKTIKFQKWLLLFSAFGMILIIFVTISAGLTYQYFNSGTFQFHSILTISEIKGEHINYSYTTTGYIYLCICVATILVETIFGFMFALKTYFMKK